MYTFSVYNIVTVQGFIGGISLYIVGKKPFISKYSISIVLFFRANF